MENKGKNIEGVLGKINSLRKEMERLSTELYDLEDRYGKIVVEKILHNKDLRWTVLWHESGAIQLMTKASKAKKGVSKEEYDSIIDDAVMIYSGGDKVVVFSEKEFVKIDLKDVDEASRFIKEWGLGLDMSSLNNVAKEAERVSKFIKEVSSK